ncbi:ABC transporter ATP-binding protein [Treponema pedis]|uniref:ABC transporter ATP-binding protein n=1 Tax=Treponema pedis TaxID=409322 RepID=UPI00041A6A37|nr:ABC transporter ATP-binding protein [Treponema pedis]
MASFDEKIIQKPKNLKTLLKRFKKIINSEFHKIFFISFTILISNLCSLAGPKFSGKAIDAIGITAGNVNFKKVFYFAGLMVGSYLTSALFSYLTHKTMIKISQRIARGLREDVFNKIITLPLKIMNLHYTGDLISRISYDIDTVNTSLTNDVIQIISSCITVLGTFILMMTISPSLIIVLLFTIPSSILFTCYRVKKTQPLFGKRSRKLGAMNGFVEEVVSGQKTIACYNAQKTFCENFDTKNIEASDAWFDAEYQAVLNGPSVNFINNLSLALIGIFGSLLFFKGYLSIGMLSSFILYSRMFSGPINEFANILGDLLSAASAAERIFALIDSPSEKDEVSDYINLKNIKGNIKFENVSFSYGCEKIGNAKLVIDNLNFEAEAGSLTAIVGETGAGKSTVINLLLRFYEVQNGTIYLDNIPITKIKRNFLRKSFALVMQEAWLFEGSIRDNISYGKSDASIEEIHKAAVAAGIADFIKSLPDGYDTVIKDSAVNISQGQKQLLTIARAMLLDAPFLILDEATSNVDSQTEILVHKAMQKLLKGRTAFVIAHRLSTIQNADKILVMQKGRIIEQGSHTELLKKNGKYSKLYMSQIK